MSEERIATLVGCALCECGFPMRDMRYRSGEYLCEECHEVVERITKAREAEHGNSDRG